MELKKQITEQLEEILQRDLHGIATRLIQHYGLKFEGLDPALKNPMVRWLDFTTRRITVKPRVIFESKEISSSIPAEFNKRYSALKQAIRSGLDLNRFQGKGLVSTQDTSSKKLQNRTDLLLADWGIYHLHLSGLPDGQDPYFSERSDYILFCVIRSDFVCLIDIKPHRTQHGFSNAEIIETAITNWRSLFEPHRITRMNRISAGVIDAAEIEELRKASLNVPVKVGDDYYMAIGGGLTTANTSVESSLKFIRINRLVFNIADMLHGKFSTPEELPTSILNIDADANILVNGNSDERLSKHLSEIRGLVIPSWAYGHLHLATP